MGQLRCIAGENSLEKYLKIFIFTNTVTPYAVIDVFGNIITNQNSI